MARGTSPAALLRSTPRAAGPAVLGVGAAVAAGGVSLLWLVVLAHVIDEAFLGGVPLRDLGAELAVLGALAVAVAGCTAARGPLLERSAQRTAGHLRTRLAQRWFDEPTGLEAADTDTADQDRRGDARRPAGVTLLVEGVDDVAGWVRGFLPAAATAVVVPLLVVVALVVVDPPSVLVLCFAGPMLVLLLAVIGRRTATAARRRQDELGWLGSLYLDLISGLATLRSFGREEDAVEVIHESSRRFGDTTMEVLRSAFQTALVMEWAATAATALVAVQVSFRLVSGRLGFGTALAVLVLTPEFFVPLRRLALEYHTGQAADAAATRLREALGPEVAGPAVPTGSGGPAHGAVAGTGPDPGRRRAASRIDVRTRAPGGRAVREGGVAVEVRDVWLTLDGERRPALRGASLSIRPGEVVALRGDSGAGKSSIAELLLAFRAPDAGEVLVDGAPLTSTDATAWRRRVAWVPQSPTVFSGSLAHNIALGEPDAPRHRVAQAAERAGLQEVITALPDGLDTVVGEGGRTLSGGERQRLAIARALLRDAPLVVFDEFTAHLDPATEQELLTRLQELLRGRSALVIAHRPATMAVAHRVLHMAHGRVLAPDEGAREGDTADVRTARREVAP